MKLELKGLNEAELNQVSSGLGVCGIIGGDIDVHCHSSFTVLAAFEINVDHFILILN